jgi:hypothetical protein
VRIVRALRRTLVGRLVGAGLLATVGLVVAALVLSQHVASGHAIFHATFAVAVLAVGGVIVASRPEAGAASLAAAAGCLLMGTSQLVEGIGALGYGVDGYTRQNGLAGLHDLGLAITPIGLVAMVLGFGLAVAILAGRWRGPGRRLAVPLAVAFALGGLALVAKMIGIA